MFARRVRSCFATKEDQQQLQIVQKEKQRRQRKQKRVWVREWLSEERRKYFGHFATFITRELRVEDVHSFQNYQRMPPELFDKRTTPGSPRTDGTRRMYRNRTQLAVSGRDIKRHTPCGAVA